jgi:D-alanine-D-alanine ligase
MKRLRVLVLLHPDRVPTDSLKSHSKQQIRAWQGDFDIIKTLRTSGHEVRVLGVQDELKPIGDAVQEWKPEVAFNLLEEFHSQPMYDQNVASYLEMLRIPYTGCNPRGLMLARGKDLSKKLVAFHRIPVPAFVVFPMNRRVKRPPRLQFPLIVKSLNEDASRGIAQASVVDNDEKLAERVAFLHERIGTPAIAEQYIDGRELYIGVLGNQRMRAFTIWKLGFEDMSGRHIATARVKHDSDYQGKRGIVQGPAEDLPPELDARMRRMAKRICRTLELDGYARIDFRLSPEMVPYFLEANPNPDISSDEEFAQAAEHDGLGYADILDRILALGIRRARVMS